MPDFETRVRALQGLRVSLAQRLDSTPVGVIETELVVAQSDGTPMGSPAPLQMTPEHYWRGVPQRYRNERYLVERVLQLQFGKTTPKIGLTVRERDRNVVA